MSIHMAITWGNPEKYGKFIKNYRIIGKHMANPRTKNGGLEFGNMTYTWSIFQPCLIAGEVPVLGMVILLTSKRISEDKNLSIFSNLKRESGWWWLNPLEKWWSSSMGFGWHPIYYMENKRPCLKPPTRNSMDSSTLQNHPHDWNATLAIVTPASKETDTQQERTPPKSPV